MHTFINGASNESTTNVKYTQSCGQVEQEWKSNIFTFISLELLWIVELFCLLDPFNDHLTINTLG